MAIQVYRPTPQKQEDALDKILKGLNAAQSVYGIYSDATKLHELKKQREELSAKEQLEYADKYNVSDEATPGSFALKGADGSVKNYSPRGKAAEGSVLTVPQQADFVKGGGKLVAPGKGQYDVQAIGPDGKPKLVGLIPPTKEGDQPKADQFKAASLGRRAELAENVFSDLERNGFNRADNATGALSLMPNVVKGSVEGGSDLQRHEQAERNFLSSILRRDSGASITPDEIKQAAPQYFPRAGDAPGVLAQKKAARAQALEGLRAEAGPAWERVAPKGGQLAQGIKKNGGKGGGLIPEALAGNKAQITAKDMEALDWLQKNPNDPDAANIKAKLRAKGL